MTWYLAYVQGGKTTKAEGGGEKIRKEFYVQQELNDMGVTNYLPRHIEFKRVGRKRYAEPFENPLLPNYIFVDTPAERFLEVLGVKYLPGPLMALSRADVAALGAFRDEVDQQYAKARRAAENREAIAEYIRGQKLEVMDSRFEGSILKFRRMVQRAHDMYPKVEASMEMMGREVIAELDPLDVRAAE